jgi:hypothetical protein
MSTFQKATILIIQVAWVILCCLPAVGMNADDAPVSVTIDSLQQLYEPVTFDHKMHSDMYDCSSCHHHTTGTGTQSKTCQKCHAASGASDDVSCSGCHKVNKTISLPANKAKPDTDIYHIDKPNLIGALHMKCLGCHRSESGPTGCQDCHAFTPAGRKRFDVKN